MLARITVRSCENVRALHLRKATLPRMLQCLIPGVKRVSGSARGSGDMSGRERGFVGESVYIGGVVLARPKAPEVAVEFLKSK